MSDKQGKSSSLSATQLRWILIGVMCLAITIGGIGVWYLNGLLAEKMAAVSDASRVAESSKTNLGRAQALKIYMENHTTDIYKAAQLVAQTTLYQYQNQIVADLTRYANAARVTITGFDFPQDIASATVDKATGLKSFTANITLANPIPYKNYLQFLKYIEQNLMQMQITDIAIAPDAKDVNMISSTLIGIQVYVK